MHFILSIRLPSFRQQCNHKELLRDGTPLYHASGTSRPEVVMPNDKPEDKRVLQFAGFCVDHIQAVGDFPEVNGLQDIDAADPALEQWKTLAKSVDVCEESFWVMLNADLDHGRGITPDRGRILLGDIRKWLRSGSMKWPSEEFRIRLNTGLIRHVFTTFRKWLPLIFASYARRLNGAKRAIPDLAR